MTKTVYAERAVTITRILKASRDLVWKAWTDPAMLKAWWGPEQFTAPVVEGDIREGGTLHVTMRGPKDSPFDRDMPMFKHYLEIVPGRKLVFENCPVGPDGERLLDGLTTVTFEDHPDGTRMQMTTSAKALTPESVNWLGGMEQGWGQSFDKLARFLA